MSFETHIHVLLRKVKSHIGFLYLNKYTFTHSSKQLLAKMTVLPILDYGGAVYRSASKTLLHKLDVIYHAAIRFVKRASFNTPLPLVFFIELAFSSFSWTNSLVSVNL